MISLLWWIHWWVHFVVPLNFFATFYFFIINIFYFCNQKTNISFLKEIIYLVVIGLVESQNSTKESNHILTVSDVLWSSLTHSRSRGLQKMNVLSSRMKKFGKNFSENHNASRQFCCARGWGLWLLFCHFLVYEYKTHVWDSKFFWSDSSLNYVKIKERLYGYPYNVISDTAVPPFYTFIIVNT